MADTPNNNLRARVRQLTRMQAFLMLLVVALAAAGGYFAYKYNEANKDVTRLANPQEAAKEEVTRLTNAVGQLIDIPKGETPTLATVSDASKLKSQAFFTKAENGDKVLIFTKAKRAILYRPSTDKIIEVAPVNLGNNETENTSQ